MSTLNIVPYAYMIAMENYDQKNINNMIVEHKKNIEIETNLINLYYNTNSISSYNISRDVYCNIKK
jgi:hypothetical protein